MTTGLGFDTGGTYTDAVIMDLDSGALLCKAKSLTTREDLSIGIEGALSGLDADLVGAVNVVSLSSTLATNSVVEGKGCRVGLVCIGMDYDHSVHADAETRIAGGHNLQGGELEPLDEAAAESFLRSVDGIVDGIAVNSYLAVRNPDHENRVRDLARSILDVPVVCGHELSSGLGFNERTSTCILNARLIPVIDELIESVKKVLASRGIKAPLMVVRGDGTMIGETTAKKRPVETILSGPAASLIGSMHITGLKDAIVMDMGGTTTDIGILRDGKPRLEPEGAIIGGRRTRVMAAEVSTSGIGGDSRIMVSGRRIILSPVRVVPMCIAASKWPAAAEHFAKLGGIETRPTPEALGEQNTLLDCEMFRSLVDPSSVTGVSDFDRRFVELVSDHPYSLNEAGAALGIHPFEFNVTKLEERGMVQRIGMTPTDLLHADGTYREFDWKASVAGADYLARKSGCTVEEFISKAETAIRDKLCYELMKELISEETGDPDLSGNALDLVMKAVTGEHGRDYGCTIKVDKPIVGIGAPAGVYIRWVGEALGAEVVVDADADVGNAIGSVTSMVSESVTFLIKPVAMGSEDSAFDAFSKLGTFKFKSLDEALTECTRIGGEHVSKAAEEGGAENVAVTSSRRDKSFTYGTGGDAVLLETELTVTAAGKPRPFGHRNLLPEKHGV